MHILRALAVNIFWIAIVLLICFIGQILLYLIAPGVIMYR